MSRRRPASGWVPNQHGAWAMLLAPVLVGSWPRPTWASVLLLLSALVGYCALYATGLWLKSRRRPKYRRPALAYVLATLVLVGCLVAIQPRLLSWAWVFVPLLVLSLVASVRRSDRTWWNDIALVVLGACLTFVAAGLRGGGLGGLASASASSGQQLLTAQPGAFAWPPLGTGAPDARAEALILFAYFVGTVIHVKALIRERRTPWVSTVDVVYHAVLALAALAWTVLGGLGAPGWFLAAVASLLAGRAWYIVTRRRDLTPKALGVVEIVMTILVMTAAIAVGRALL